MNTLYLIIILVCTGPIALLEFWLFDSIREWLKARRRRKETKPLKFRKSARSR